MPKFRVGSLISYQYGQKDEVHIGMIISLDGLVENNMLSVLWPKDNCFNKTIDCWEIKAFVMAIKRNLYLKILSY